MRYPGIYNEMKKKKFLTILIASLALCLFMAFGRVYGQEFLHMFGILSETYVYPYGIRLDVDSKLFVWSNTLTPSDDTADKREGDMSLKMAANALWGGFAIAFWDTGGDSAMTRDMSFYEDGSLQLWFKADMEGKSVCNLKIGIRSGGVGPEPIVEKWVYLDGSNGSPFTIPADNQWRFISIPFSYFNGINFSKISEPFRFVNKEYTTITPGDTFHFDNVRWYDKAAGELNSIQVSPASWTLPPGTPKTFYAQGYDASAHIVDTYPTWSRSGISGNFNPAEGPMVIFTPTSPSGSGSVTASYGGKSGISGVAIQDISLNQFFNIFIDEGLYGSIGTYDSDGDASSANNITLDTVTNVCPPGHTKSLKAVYSISATGWAGFFFQEGETLVINPDAENGDTEPTGWAIINDNLTNETGWVEDEYKSPSHSLKILNTADDVKSRWCGTNVALEEPYPTEIRFSGWAKAQSVTARTFCLYFQVWFEDGTKTTYCADLGFATGTHGWEYRESIHDFGKPITALKPYCLMNFGTGTAWFDDINMYAETNRYRDLSGFADGYLHFWVKTPVDLEIGIRTDNIPEGTETSKVRLSEYNVPHDNSWQEVYIALDDFEIRDRSTDLDMSKVFFNAAVVGKYTGGCSGVFYISDVKYVRHKDATPTISAHVKRRDNNQPEDPEEMGFEEAELGTGWVIADQYFEIVYDTDSPSWGIQIFTDNMGDDASPEYSGDPDEYVDQQPAGLIGAGEPFITCPMAWMVLDETSDNIPVPVEDPTGNFFTSDTGGVWGGDEPAQSEWSWLKDMSSTRWDDLNDNDIVDPGEILPDFSLTGDEYSTFIGQAGIATGWGDIEDNTRVYILNPESPVILYLAANFEKATVLQKYKTNTITLELYHY